MEIDLQFVLCLTSFVCACKFGYNFVNALDDEYEEKIDQWVYRAVLCSWAALSLVCFTITILVYTYPPAE